MKLAWTAAMRGVMLAILATAVGRAEGEDAAPLFLEQDDAAETIVVHRGAVADPILTQHAREDFRPYLHPIVAPDGRGHVTEFSPSHHKHQTGLYWGFTRLNGRDYFHHPGGDYWRRVSAAILKREASAEDPTVIWQTVYDLLDADGAAVLRETQTWTMRDRDGMFVLDLEWKAEARTHVTVGKYDYGGLFLRMPWTQGVRGSVVNSARQINRRAEGQRAVWLDVGIEVPGRDDLAHVAIFDHPKNGGFPQPWRVDGQLGVGPARARLGDWKLEAGRVESIRHRLLVYTGNLDDVRLNREWSRYTGRGYSSSQWQVAQREGRAAKFLTPQAAVDAMTVRDDFQVNVFAAEPMITQPMAFCWDDRGRLWVAENRDYESRGKGFSNSGDSRVLILEDTDRDGRADKRSVFVEGIPFPAAIAVGFDGLWLGAPPNLLFIPDRDGDDRGDIDEVEVRLTGWGIRDRHETLNSLHWGPDGWLYGLQGYATPSRVGPPAGNGRIYRHNDPFPDDIEFEGEPVEINGGVWRYHPTRNEFEVVAHGFSNPWGIDFDAKGQLFITACVIPHLWHVIPGGVYHRQGGSHFNPYVYRDIRTIADHSHRSAHGGARIYLSDAFPEEYHGRIFMANIHEHAVLTDVLERKGSGFVGRHGDDFLLANNAQWIGFSVEIGPQGDLYVLDWHDADICGKDVLNKETGRIFRVEPKASAADDFEGRDADLRTLADRELAELQLSRSAWHARRARLVLQGRAANGDVSDAAVQRLESIFQSHADPDLRLRAMWALHAIACLDSQTLQATLDDADEYVRAWAIQLLCERPSPGEAVREKLATLARLDPSPVVRLYLASALQRLAHEYRWPIVEGLAAHTEDEGDHNLPKMIWFGLEPLVPEQPDRSLALAERAIINPLPRWIARRLTDANQLDSVVAAIGDAPPETRRQLLLGMRDGLEGLHDVEPPSQWITVYDRIEKAGGESARLAMQLARQFGDQVAFESLLKTLRNDRAEVAARREALRGISGRHSEAFVDALIELLDNDALRTDAIRASANCDSARLGRQLLERYHAFDAATRLEVIHAMAARSGSGRQLTAAIEQGDVDRRDVPAYVARTLHRVVGNGFLEVWGPLEALGQDQQLAFAKYRDLLTSDALAAADLRRGRAVFGRACLVCHRLYGEGGEIGPDITGANRSNLEYLLGNILTPSAVIQDAYKMQLVLTDEGRLHSGIFAGENERQLRLRVPGSREPIVIAKSQIESQETAAVSMMPVGLLASLTDEEVTDLFAYLQSQRQVPLPE